MTQLGPCFAPQGTVKLPTICSNDYNETDEPHEPPIGFDDGSLYMSWDLQLQESGQVPNDPRPYKYILGDSSKYRGAVAVLKVITETNEGKVTYLRYLIPKTTDARLLIWLQQSKSNPQSGEPPYEDPTAEAQVLVQGDNLRIESDERFSAPYSTYKPKRPYGYEYPWGSQHFRIAKWAVVDSNGAPVYENNDPNGALFSDSNQDGYKIYVYFHDLD